MIKHCFNVIIVYFRYIEVSLQEWTEKKNKEGVEKDITELYFRPFLRWMDRNMETIVTEGLKQVHDLSSYLRK